MPSSAANSTLWAHPEYGPYSWSKSRGMCVEIQHAVRNTFSGCARKKHTRKKYLQEKPVYTVIALLCHCLLLLQTRNVSACKAVMHQGVSNSGKVSHIPSFRNFYTCPPSHTTYAGRTARRVCPRELRPSDPRTCCAGETTKQRESES